MPPYTKQRKSFSPYRASPSEPCVIYTRTGRCDSGRNRKCRYAHIPHRRALCMPLFKTGKCTKPGSERCLLSHRPVPQNTPMCEYFENGRCTNGNNCKYVHMSNLGPPSGNGKRTPVCRNFALNGWCDRGAACSKRHSFDCPDFEAHGKCLNKKCTLQHVILDPAAEAEQPSAAFATQSHDVSDGIMQKIRLPEFIKFIEFMIADPKAADESCNVKSSTFIPDGERGENVLGVSGESDESNSGSGSSGSDDDDNDDQMDFTFDSDADEELDVDADFIKV